MVWWVMLKFTLILKLLFCRLQKADSNHLSGILMMMCFSFQPMFQVGIFAQSEKGIGHMQCITQRMEVTSSMRCTIPRKILISFGICYTKLSLQKTSQTPVFFASFAIFVCFFALKFPRFCDRKFSLYR